MQARRVSLPPYGVMSRNFLDLRARGQPRDWVVETDWAKWLNSVSRKLQANIWPTYDFKNGSWRGVASATATALTAEELEFMRPFRKNLRDFVDTPEKCFIRHEFLRDAEDLRIGGRLDLYSQTVATAFGQYLSNGSSEDWFDGIIDANYGSTIVELKARFQRPRPYQCATILKCDDFSQELSRSFITPSLPSGHCFEATMALLELYKRLLEAPATNQRTSSGPIELYAAHISDRRVMAGLHFPTDNIASWYLAYSMCKTMYPQQPLLVDFIRGTVRQSLLYQGLEMLSPRASPKLSKIFEWACRELRLKPTAEKKIEARQMPAAIGEGVRKKRVRAPKPRVSNVRHS